MSIFLRPTDTLPLVLPYPPTSNLYWRMWRGRMVLSAEARAYRELAALTARSARRPMLEGQLVVWLEFYRPRRAGDLDNALKIALDAMRGVLYRDDRQIAELHAHRNEDKARPRLEVWLDLVS